MAAPKCPKCGSENITQATTKDAVIVYCDGCGHIIGCVAQA